jgi:hypothetical protein
MTVTAIRGTKSQYENVTQGLLGVVQIDRNNNPVGQPVEPGDFVWLTDEEVELSSQAHKRPDDSPFTIREIVHRDPRTHNETARFTAAPLRKVERTKRAGA